jgi:hypothetical protein
MAELSRRLDQNNVHLLLAFQGLIFFFSLIFLVCQWIEEGTVIVFFCCCELVLPS